MQRNVLVSFSGGRTSSFMANWLINNSKDNLIFVFANTGKELPETLDFINECDQRWNLNIKWIEYDSFDEYGKRNWFKVVDYETASRQGEPFEKFIEKEGIPNKVRPICSSRLKEIAIEKFVRHVIKWKDWFTAIGIRYDERHRINWKTAKERRFLYPLTTDFPCSKYFVRHWWDTQPFDLNLNDYQGNCDFCWKKSHRKLITMIREGFDPSWWIEQEQKSEFNFYREDVSMLDLIEMSKDKRIRSVEDSHEVSKKQGSLFDPLDIEGHCLCNFSE